MNPSRLLLIPLALILSTPALRAQPLPGTRPLTAEGDLAAQMVAGIDKYLMRELAGSVEKRKQFWKPDFSSPEAYAKSVEPNRERLRTILGVVDRRVSPVTMNYVADSSFRDLVAETDLYKVHAVRWPVFEGVHGEGLLLEPKGKVVAQVIAIPDADWTPEMLVGLAKGVPKESQFARRLAENGCRVIVPVLIDRQDTWSGSERLKRYTNQPHREFVYRMAFEMGRHIIGYEVQKVLAAVDWCTREKAHPPVGIFGYGEGGLLALYSTALDPRIKTAVVSGYIGPREEIWKEPIYRNVWQLLREHGDGDLMYFIIPRALIVEHAEFKPSDPPSVREGRQGAAPGSLGTPALKQSLAELARIFDQLKQPDTFKIKQLRFITGIGVAGGGGEKPHITKAPGLQPSLSAFLEELGKKERLISLGDAAQDSRKDFDPAPRQKRQFEQLCEYTQKLYRESHFKRQEFFWAKLDLEKIGGLTPPARLEAYQKSIEPLRKYFEEEVIGKLPAPSEPKNPRTRQIHDEPKWKGYEVVLDLYPDVFAYGILLVPKDLKEGEKRPVVVCQHGLEGRPQDVINPTKKTPYYNSFGAQLADRGYIVYAPQNPYIGQDKFRVLQRKANPLKLSLFSFIVRQHERTLDWLETLPFVDKDRLAFYGLSYGGKTAMRVPAILPRYCLSICSGDFNEWIWKNVNLEWRGSYMFTGEYEMFEFDLGHTFNYAEMSALIAPRPFMVERGHDDGVGLDEYVAFEYAKVRRLYAKLGLADRTEIEFFSGGHVINGKGTFAFLDKHLKR